MEPVSISLILIICNVAFSLAGFSSPGLIKRFAESPWEIRQHGRWYQLITSGFLHANFGHLFVNMLTLYFFGPPMERALGTGPFLILYLGSLLGGSFLTYLAHRSHRSYRALGASGAISGVLFGFVLFRPLAPIYLFFIPIGIPAVLFAVLYVGVSLYGMRSRFGRIGHEAHLGGALAGLFLTVALYPDALRIFFAHFK